MTIQTEHNLPRYEHVQSYETEELLRYIIGTALTKENTHHIWSTSWNLKQNYTRQ